MRWDAGESEAEVIGNYFEPGVPMMRNFVLTLVIATTPATPSLAPAEAFVQAPTAYTVPAFSVFCDMLPSWLQGVCQAEAPNT